MLRKLASLGGGFVRKADHPLADARQLGAVIAELPADDAFRTLDEVTGWLESLVAAEDFAPAALFPVVCRLGDAAWPAVRRLSREYVQAPRLSRSEEKRLWELCQGFWARLAAAYERCLPAGESGVPAASLPALATRLLVALGTLLKWERFRYGPAGGDLWGRMGRALLAAESVGAGSRPVAAGAAGAMSPAQEYARAMVLHAASPDSATPQQMEVMERLVAHFLPGFLFAAEAAHDSVYWVDLASAVPPQRLARMPAEALPTLRFFKPGPAHAALVELLATLERGGELPPDLPLGGAWSPRIVLAALRQLTSYLAPVPPQRTHERHRVQHRMAVAIGFADVRAVLAGEAAAGGVADWIVENVSRGGFGAVAGSLPGERLRIGTVVAMRPPESPQWLLGIVRRCHRVSDSQAQVGVEALSRRAVCLPARGRGASGYAAAGELSAVLLPDGEEPGELRLLLPFASFDARLELLCSIDGRQRRLAPVALVEQTPDYELARFRPLD